jgi:hypothetical protein
MLCSETSPGYIAGTFLVLLPRFLLPFRAGTLQTRKGIRLGDVEASRACAAIDPSFLERDICSSFKYTTGDAPQKEGDGRRPFIPPLKHGGMKGLNCGKKYDAEKTLAAFSATLHDEVNLEQVRAVPIYCCARNDAAAHISLWLRQTELQTAELVRRLEP